MKPPEFFREIQVTAAYDASKELLKLMSATLAASVAAWLHGHPAVVWLSALCTAVLIMFLERRKARPRLEIESARWTCTTDANASWDVKDILDRLNDGDAIRLLASDQNLGDPCKDHGGDGHSKRLEVDFARRGRVVVFHNKWLKL